MIKETDMAAFDTTRPHATTGSASRIGTMFTTAVGAFAAWNDTRNTLKVLSKLSDRELNDIGLTRADVVHGLRRS